MNRNCRFGFLITVVSFTFISSNKCFSQEAMIREVQKQFVEYSINHPQEKLFVHTDKDIYLVGEIVWFKLYYDKKTPLSKVAYVDVVDAGNRSVLAVKISLNEYEDNGSLLLPLSLNSGHYTLRTYTNWMKNSPEISFFEKNISVINPFKNPDTSVQKKVEGYEASFFPEGGNMVIGLESKVGFKLCDKYGKGVDAKGVIINTKGETVASFQTHKFGMGNFNFIPLEKNYKAVITFADGRTATKDLPAVYENGYVMSVGSNNENVMVKLTTNFTGPQTVFIYVRNQQTLKFSSSGNVINGSGTFTVPKAILGKGVIQITVFNAINQPVCERLHFIKPDDKNTISLSLANNHFSTRKPVQITINAKDPAGKPVSANMSVAVLPVDSLQQLTEADIKAYMWLTSELKGNIESPAYYLSGNDGTEQAADNLMLTQGWRRFNWDKILSKTKETNNYLAEYDGHFVSVKLIDTRTDKPVSDKEVFLSAPGRPFSFVTAVTDSFGIARFSIKNIYGLKKLIFQANTPEANFYRMELLSPFFAPSTNSAISYLPFDQQQLLEKYSVNMQVQNIYSADSMRIFYAHNTKDTLPFYGKTMYSYNLDDYTRFTTMDEPRKEFNEDDLLVLWDGLPLQDPHNIFKFDPLRVKRLEVLPRRIAAGESLFKGIASFTTYNSDLSGYSLNADMLSTDYEGLQLQREFYSPSYETAEQLNSRIPDYRNTLYWSPNVITNNKGETKVGFYTSDRLGKYIAILQGVDDEGNPVSATITFSVSGK
jgi:hypothetical protein